MIARATLLLVLLIFFHGISQAQETRKRPVVASADGESFLNKDMADEVRQGYLHAWNGYKTYAWGMDALKPLSKTGHNWYKNSLLMTPVDAFDGLVIM